MKYVETYKKPETNPGIVLDSIEAEILHNDNITTVQKILNAKNIYNRKTIDMLCSGNVPHHYPLYVEQLQELGFDKYVSEGISDEIREIFNLFEELEK